MIVNFAIHITRCFTFPGSAHCPYYAKIELLADSLQKNVPDFKLHKIVKHPDEWEVSNMLMFNNYSYITHTFQEERKCTVSITDFFNLV